MSQLVPTSTLIVPVELNPEFSTKKTTLHALNPRNPRHDLVIGPHWKAQTARQSKGTAMTISMENQCAGPLILGYEIYGNTLTNIIIRCNNCNLHLSNGLETVFIPNSHDLLNLINRWITAGFGHYLEAFPGMYVPEHYVHAPIIGVHNPPDDPGLNDWLFYCTDMLFRNSTDGNPVAMALVPTQDSLPAGMYAMTLLLGQLIEISLTTAKATKAACGIQ